MRFCRNQVHKRQAKWLEEELQRYKVKLFIATPEAGEDITVHVLKRMEAADAMIVMGTQNYGEGEICSFCWTSA